jgi:hypothetical protein
MNIDHLSKLDEEIDRYNGEIFQDEQQINLLSENLKRNKKIVKLLEDGREKLKSVKKEDGNTQQKKG